MNTLEKIKRTIEREKWLRIIYKDSKGVITERVIIPFNLFETSDGYFLEAYCELRGENRTFKVDRIIKCNMLNRGCTIIIE